MRLLSNRRVATIFALVLTSGLCVLLLSAREWHTGTNGYRFLTAFLALAYLALYMLSSLRLELEQSGARR